MGENVIRLYLNGKLTDAGLQRAVTFGWITAEQYTELIAGHFERNEE